MNTPRPKRYRLSGGPWQRTLVILVRAGYPDSLVAQVLQDLSSEAFARINRMDAPDAEQIESLRETDAGLRWTRWMVEHHRYHGLKMKSRHPRALYLWRWWNRGRRQ